MDDFGLKKKNLEHEYFSDLIVSLYDNLQQKFCFNIC